jgi:hypothetical protein
MMSQDNKFYIKKQSRRNLFSKSLLLAIAKVNLSLK